MKICLLRKLGIFLVCCVMASATFGQSYPSRNVKVIVPFGPGTAIDIIVRHLAEALTKSMGQTFVVENRAGASGTIAAAYVAASAPDGYTILTNASTHTSAPAMMGKLSYDAVRDFAGITTVTDSVLVLVVAKSSGIKTVGDLIALAKAKPGSLTYASAGVATSTHLTAEKFRTAAGLDALHVPFKSTPDALTEVLAGRVTFTYTGVASALPLIKDGRLVPLAVGGFRRTNALPDTPTIEEAGASNAGYAGWLGWLVPAKTPRDVIDRLHGELVKALNTPDMKEKLSKAGTDAWTMSSEEFDSMLRREAVANERLINDLGLRRP